MAGTFKIKEGNLIKKIMDIISFAKLRGGRG
jgi:hypothetical protein